MGTPPFTPRPLGGKWMTRVLSEGVFAGVPEDGEGG